MEYILIALFVGIVLAVIFVVFINNRKKEELSSEDDKMSLVVSEKY